jgi:hypothetical protein
MQKLCTRCQRQFVGITKKSPSLRKKGMKGQFNRPKKEERTIKENINRTINKHNNSNKLLFS